MDIYDQMQSSTSMFLAIPLFLPRESENTKRKPSFCKAYSVDSFVYLLLKLFFKTQAISFRCSYIVFAKVFSGSLLGLTCKSIVGPTDLLPAYCTVRTNPISIFCPSFQNYGHSPNLSNLTRLQTKCLPPNSHLHAGHSQQSHP